MRFCYRMKKRAQPPQSASNHRFHKFGWSFALNYVAKAYQTVRNEIVAYGANLEVKVEIVALNKCDALPPEEVSACADRLAAACGTTPLRLSAVTGMGIGQALQKILAAIDKADAAEKVHLKETAWQP